ncbi:MAG: hypothetical protein PF904_21685 [Kiritimatiellae bacterium]|nr:hypothetical protein [Kiritimatiellia bacterium]
MLDALGLKETVCHPGVNVKTNGHFTRVNLTVRPVATGMGASPESPLYLIILEEVPGESEGRGQRAEVRGQRDEEYLLYEDLPPRGLSPWSTDCPVRAGFISAPRPAPYRRNVFCP